MKQRTEKSSFLLLQIILTSTVCPLFAMALAIYLLAAAITPTQLRLTHTLEGRSSEVNTRQLAWVGGVESAREEKREHKTISYIQSQHNSIAQANSHIHIDIFEANRRENV